MSSGNTPFFIKVCFAPSNSEAKRLIQQNGITVNDEGVNALDKTYTSAELKEGLIVRKGKKHFKKAILV
jgi:tyrosyl-tRNA synthetase